MRAVRTGKIHLAFYAVLSAGLGAFVSFAPRAEAQGTGGKTYKFEVPSAVGVEAESSAAVPLAASTRPALSLAVTTTLPNVIRERDVGGRRLAFDGSLGGSGVELTRLSRPLFVRGNIGVRARVGVGYAHYRRDDAIAFEGRTLRDRQELHLIPIPLELEASQRFASGLSPVASLSATPVVALASSALLRDGSVGLGALGRASIGARQEFWSDNALMLELQYSWNKILDESPDGLGLRLGYQRSF